ncbi:MAG: S8 family serine peptidase [Chloroflexi bacterium]|nr:S8 family serine peptidase [Chloroflexota bacterium]
MLKRSVTIVLFLLISAATSLPARATGGVYVDPLLQQQLSTTAATSQLIAVANFDSAVSSGSTLSSAIQDLGAGTITFHNLDSVAVLGTPSQISAVSNLNGVTELYANRQLQYLMREANAYIGADKVWSQLGITGQGIGAAIIDSGVDGTHPDLTFGSKTVQNAKVIVNQSDIFTTKGKPSQPLYVENLANTDTSSGHGTHVAGIIGGSGAASSGYYTGVAPGANLVGVSTGETLVILWALAGFDYVLDHQQQYNIKVVNNSWGSSGGAAGYDPKDPIQKASKKAHDKGITVVFAAGNDGPAPDTMNPYAEAPWVIGVAAGCYPSDTAHCPDGLLADFSSRGVAGSSQFHPTLTAPGAHIVSTRATTGTALNALDGQHDLTKCGLVQSGALYLAYYTCASGTSMATPMVVGTVALMQQAAGGKLSPDQVKNTLVKTARPMAKTDGTPYGLWEAGAGYMDAYAAVVASKK